MYVLFTHTATVIGFEREQYSVREDKVPPFVRNLIYIIKENTAASELTFRVRIQYSNGTAFFGQDFSLFIPPDRIDDFPEEFSPDEARFAVNFQVIQDTITEGNETFSFELSNAGEVNFQTGQASTEIIIVDDEG